MAPISATHVTPHFSRAEVRYDQTPPVYRDNLEALCWWLEELRAAARRPTDPAPGVRLLVYSAWRGELENREAGGVSTSQHLTASAADFKVLGIDVATFLERLEASGVDLGSREVVVYPLRGGSGVHAGLPIAGNPLNTVLVQVAGGRYESATLGDSAAVYRDWRRRAGEATVQVLGAVILAGVAIWLAGRYL
jgi:hypothetical protein